MSDELELGVQQGNPSTPGFAVQNDAEGVYMGAGAYSESPVAYGITNDECGVGINAKVTYAPVYTLHYFEDAGDADLTFAEGERPTCEVLVVAGGGTGGGGIYGGGGGGGEVKSIDAVELGGTIPVVVGAGGVGGFGVQGAGQPSSFGGNFLYCHGGGCGGVGGANIGGEFVYTPPTAEWTGGGMYSDGVLLLTPAPHGPWYWGGCGAKGTMYGYLGTSGGGGGGAGQCGWDADSNWGGGGGDGIICNIVDHRVRRWWGSGGGGSVWPHSYIPGLFTYGWGGRGGGGGASGYLSVNEEDESSDYYGDPFNYAELPTKRDYRGAGYPNSGGGGGATSNYGENSPQSTGCGLSMDGGRGVVIVRYAGPPCATGGRIETRKAEEGA